VPQKINVDPWCNKIILSSLHKKSIHDEDNCSVRFWSKKRNYFWFIRDISCMARYKMCFELLINWLNFHKCWWHATVLLSHIALTKQYNFTFFCWHTLTLYTFPHFLYFSAFVATAVKRKIFEIGKSILCAIESSLIEYMKSNISAQPWCRWPIA